MLSVQHLVPTLIAAAVVVIGWPIAHWLTRKREISAEKRKTRITYLLEAYRKLEDAGNRPIKPGSEDTHNIEKAIADIQLLGSPEQILLAVNFAKEFASNGTASFDPILYDLRRSLRQELELEETDTKLLFLRIN